MKKSYFSFLFLLLVIVVNAFAQTEIKLNSSKTNFTVLEQSPYKIKIKASYDKIRTIPVSTSQGSFIELAVQGFSKIYDAGKPQLPVLGKLIEIPYGAEVRVNIISYKEQQIKFNEIGISQKIIPAQPSVSKSANENEIPFVYDQAFYTTNAFNDPEMVSVSSAGIMRGVQVGNLTVSPFRYNPVSNILKVYNELVFEVVFKHPDVALTEQMKEKYYSPYFESSLSNLINHKQPASKDVITKYPVKYVIVGYSTTALNFQAAMQPFVKWKRQKGFNVIEQYYSSVPTIATVKDYLSTLYNSGTTSDPAPTFVLLVGDIQQIPTNPTTISGYSHKTDLYYCTMNGTSDYIPDMYYGRFSATTLAQLQPQIDKTIEYEKYLMPNPAYLDTVVMIGGVDASYGPVWANGQINYGTANYFNAAHGIFSYTHLYPNSGNEDAAILTEIGKGVGYANYTAHGSSDGWADPTFSKTNIAAMNNAHQYGLMVGNCCLTNTFSDTECFGEALLRTANKGALGYIGGSNNSYWDEDYYWGVGNRSSIVLNPTYDAANLGGYDRMFHDHAEPKTSWYYTNDQMVYAGNLAVESSASTLKKYYWEIYHLMGDPAVMTYFSIPDPMTVAYTSPQNVGISSLVVNTVEDAYVAISHNGVLLDADLAPVGGVVTLNFTTISTPDTLDVVVTKQNKQPYIGTLIITAPSVALDAELVGITTPEATYNCTGINVAPQVVIRNNGINTISTLRITYQVSGGSAQIFNWSGSLTTGQSATVTLPTILIAAGTYTFSVATSLPNNGTDQNTSNDSKTRNYSASNLPVSSDFSGDVLQVCSAPANVQFTNNSLNALSYSWDFGDGSISTLANPTHSYIALGTYTVVLTASAGICGSDAETKTSYITVGATPPQTFNGSICGPGMVTLMANAGGTINWYDAATAGNLLYTGNTFLTPNLTTTSTYYAEQSIIPPLEYGAKPDSNSDATLHTNNGYWLLFDCTAPVVLKSVKVYAGAAGSRTFTLNSSAGTVLQTVTVNISANMSRITLNFNIPVGTGMSIRSTTTNPNMLRDQSGINFPYDIGGKISITGSNASPSIRYYYFYDWEIQSPSCSSARIPVTASILSAPAAAQFTFSQAGGNVNFTNSSANGTSYLWNFGDGTTSTSTNPSHTYATSGNYNVMLITTNNCNSDTVYHNVVIVITGVEENSLGNIEIYPNPARDYISIKLNNTVMDQIVLTDIIGKELLRIKNMKPVVTIDLKPYKDGVYFIRLISGDKTINHRITKTQ
jgi:PKD repeat protein